MQPDSIRKKMHCVFAFSAADKEFPASLVFAFGGDFAPAFFGGVGVDTAAVTEGLAGDALAGTAGVLVVRFSMFSWDS